MHSRVLAFLLVFLLLAMQQETHVHALTHAGQALQRADEHFQLPGDNAPCDLCGLLASGSNAVATHCAIAPFAIAHAVAHQSATAAFTTSPLRYYRSRAPPALL